MKTKDSKATIRAFPSMITKKNQLMKFRVVEGTEFAEEISKFWEKKGIEIQSGRSETKASFAESTIRSLKIMLNRYKEDYRCKYNHKMTQFITARINSRKNCPIDLIPQKVKTSNFFSVLHSKPLREYKKQNF